jgi:P27 family predicted phage terminase small subunit
LISLKRVRESLIEQLEKKGANVEVFIDMIDQYIEFTKIERELVKDIKNNGFSYETISATGKEYVKDNPSVKLATQYNKQRLAILAQLGLTVKTVETSGDDDL